MGPRRRGLALEVRSQRYADRGRRGVPVLGRSPRRRTCTLLCKCTPTRCGTSGNGQSEVLLPPHLFRARERYLKASHLELGRRMALATTDRLRWWCRTRRARRQNLPVADAAVARASHIFSLPWYRPLYRSRCMLGDCLILQHDRPCFPTRPSEAPAASNATCSSAPACIFPPWSTRHDGAHQGGQRGGQRRAGLLAPFARVNRGVHKVHHGARRPDARRRGHPGALRSPGVHAVSGARGLRGVRGRVSGGRRAIRRRRAPSLTTGMYLNPYCSGSIISHGVGRRLP